MKLNITLGMVIALFAIGIKLILSEPAVAHPGPATLPAAAEPAAWIDAGKISREATTSVAALARPATPSMTSTRDASESAPVAMTPADSTSLPPDRYASRGIPAEPVHLDLDTLRTARIGDRLALEVPQLDTPVDMLVDTLAVHTNGDLMLAGIADGRSTVLTLGQSHSFATINTAAGTYSLEARNEVGWVVAAEDVEALVDPTVPDFRVPDIDRFSHAPDAGRSSR